MQYRRRVFFTYHPAVFFFLIALLFTFSMRCTPLLALEERKKTVCLNMIVKDEKEVITRCLESVLPIIDTWVIVDTGSKDGTQETIRNFLGHIPGNLYERPWVDFGYNRQEALLLAKEKADYILFMDADDKLAFSDDFKMPHLTKDFYAIPSHSNGQVHWFPRLIKADLDWFWEGVLHEDLFCKSKIEGVALDGIKYIYVHDGARAKDPNTIKKDILLLEKATKSDPQNPRNFFYLARSYMSANMPKLALDCFEKRAQMKGNAEEIFYSNLMIGHLKNSLRFDPKIIEDSFLKAYLNRPHRAEPLYYLACKLCERNEHEKSYEILRLALELPAEVTDYMYMEQWIYDYGLLLQLVVCAKHTGRYYEGIEACNQLLKKSALPEKQKLAVQSHFEELHQLNIKQIQNKISKILAY